MGVGFAFKILIDTPIMALNGDGPTVAIKIPDPVIMTMD